jgi:hypothetical protein
MPGEESMLPNRVVDSPEFNVAELLGGRGILEQRMRLVYEPSGARWWRWWRETYHYAVHYRLRPFPESPASSTLTMVDGQAD